MAETQYRTLGPDEVIQEGDECQYQNDGWLPVMQSVGWGPSDWPDHQFRRPITPAYTVTELHTPSGSLDAVTARCERAEKALGVATKALSVIHVRAFRKKFDSIEDIAEKALNQMEALAQIEEINTDTEK